MATTKTKPKRRKRSKALSSNLPRRRRTRKKGLSEMFDKQTAIDSFKGVLASSSGGFGAVIATKSILPPTAGKFAKVATGLVAGFLASNFKMPMLGAGFAGGMIALAFKDGLLADDELNETEFADDDVLSEMPLYLDENGEAMVLEENDGDPFFRYLSEEELSAHPEAEYLY